MHTHWSQFVPSMSIDIRGHLAPHHDHLINCRMKLNSLVHKESRREQNLSRHHFVCSMGRADENKNLRVIILCALWGEQTKIKPVASRHQFVRTASDWGVGGGWIQACNAQRKDARKIGF